MNLDDVTPQLLVEKFHKWCNRVICDALRQAPQMGQYVVECFNIQERPKTVYGTKVFVETLEVILPDEDGILEMDWYLRLRRDLRRWRSVFETLSLDDYTDMTVEDVAVCVIDDPQRLEDLLQILDKLEES